METHFDGIFSTKQYLAMLETAEIKYEYWDGVVEARPTASVRHNLICGSILGNLWHQLRTGTCRPAGSDQLIRKQGESRYVFADVVVRCRDARFESGAVEALNDPVVVFEVLSPATEFIDRKKKFAYYSTFESLKELVLVNQVEQLVEHFHRESAQDEWRVAHLFADEEELVLGSVGARLSVAEIYEGVEW